MLCFAYKDEHEGARTIMGDNVCSGTLDSSAAINSNIAIHLQTAGGYDRQSTHRNLQVAIPRAARPEPKAARNRT